MVFKHNQANLIALMTFLLGSLIFVVATNSTINETGFLFPKGKLIEKSGLKDFYKNSNLFF